MKDIKDYKQVVIGVDHGYGNIKTAHTVLLSGVDKLTGEAIASSNVMKYKGISYVIGESHMTYQGEKTSDENYFVLTLAAIGEELSARGYKEANVVLAAGLPLTWISSQRKPFREYLLTDPDPEFSYKGQAYRIHISKVFIFPQGLAESGLIDDLSGSNMIADIGNGTMNIVMIKNGRPIEKSLVTENLGISYCIRKAQNDLSRAFGVTIPEDAIEEYLINSPVYDTSERTEVVKNAVQAYADEIVKVISLHGFEKGYTKLHLFGGGSRLLKVYTSLPRMADVFFHDDICANAKGYEILAKKKLEAGAA